MELLGPSTFVQLSSEIQRLKIRKKIVVSAQYISLEEEKTSMERKLGKRRENLQENVVTSPTFAPTRRTVFCIIFCTLRRILNA